MHRRRFIAAGIATAGAAPLVGRAGATGGDDVRRFDVPPYGEWIPAESRTPEAGVFFTHLDFEALGELDDAESGPPRDGTESFQLERFPPILELPLYGSFLTPFATVGILLYPFADDILPDDRSVDGVETRALTWVDETLVFHGDYSPETFETDYADGFSRAGTLDEFTVYVGDTLLTDELAYAVSEEIVVAGTMPGEDDPYTAEDLVLDSLRRVERETGRVVDDDDGRWLFETTGDARIALGGWRIDELADELEGSTDDAEPDAPGADSDADAPENPLIGNAESFLNTISYDAVAGEMTDIGARFSALYPDGEAPSETEARIALLGFGDVPHDVFADENRLHVAARLDDEPPTASAFP